MTFDPKQFVDNVVTEASATKQDPCPEGEWEAEVMDVKVKDDLYEKDGRVSAITDVVCKITDPECHELAGRDNIISRHTIFIDLDPETSKILTGPGINMGLGKFRTAVGMNDGDFSFGTAIGTGLMVSVSHREYEGNTYDDIKRVAPLD